MILNHPKLLSLRVNQPINNDSLEESGGGESVYDPSADDTADENSANDDTDNEDTANHSSDSVQPELGEPALALDKAVSPGGAWEGRRRRSRRKKEKNKRRRGGQGKGERNKRILKMYQEC